MRLYGHLGCQPLFISLKTILRACKCPQDEIYQSKEADFAKDSSVWDMGRVKFPTGDVTGNSRVAKSRELPPTGTALEPPNVKTPTRSLVSGTL